MSVQVIEEVRPCSIKEIAEIYNMSTKTIRNWLRPHLKEIGKRQGRYYTIKQVKIIFTCLGLPCVVKANDLLI
jgi:transposase